MTRRKQDKIGRTIWPPMNEPEKDLPPQLKTKRTKIVYRDDGTSYEVEIAPKAR